MNWVLILASFAGMEIASWLIHRYLMHGPLWFIHKTHHEKTKGVLEFNDLFSLFFGSIAAALMILGAATQSTPFWIGLGITLYGLCYFILHDILIHRRLKFGGWPKKGYLRWMIKAHQAHHKSIEKDGSESFGLFWFDEKFKSADKQ